MEGIEWGFGGWDVRVEGVGIRVQGLPVSPVTCAFYSP